MGLGIPAGRGARPWCFCCCIAFAPAPCRWLSKRFLMPPCGLQNLSVPFLWATAVRRANQTRFLVGFALPCVHTTSWFFLKTGALIITYTIFGVPFPCHNYCITNIAQNPILVIKGPILGFLAPSPQPQILQSLSPPNP